MNTTHADSQVDIPEVIGLKQAALNSREHRGSRRLVSARTVSTAEALNRYELTTPEGPLHEVVLTNVASRETYWHAYYREESDAIAVWQHLADAARESGTAKATK